MSDTRLQSITTQQLALQNPDGSFPPLGVVLTVTDSVGTVAPVTDISVNSVRANQINITGSIIQNNVVSQSITSEDITLSSFTGNKLLPYDVSASRLITPLLNTVDTNTNYAAADSFTVSTGGGFATHVIASTINATTVKTETLNASTLTSRAGFFTDVSAISVLSTILNTNNLIAKDVSSNILQVNTATSDYINVGNLQTNNISANTVSAQSATVTSSLSTKNLSVQGDFTFNTINLQNLTSTNIIANDISTNLLTVAGLATLGDVSSTTLNIRELRKTGTYTAANIRANTFTSDFLTLPNTLKPTTLTLTGTTNMANVSANTITSALPTMTNMTGTKNRTTNAYISSAINLGGGGLLKYTSELLMNDVSASSIYILKPPVPFGAASADNGLATVADIKSSLTSTVSIFNNFMGQFNSRGIVIDLSPKLVFNSTMSMQFILSGVVTAPVVFSAGVVYSLNEVIRALNAVCSSNIVFSTKNISGNLWQTTITVVNDPLTTYIADSSNTYTSSLQLLRWLGFTIDPFNNPFQTYRDSTITNIPLINSPYISNIFDATNPLIYPNINPTFPLYNITNLTTDAFNVNITNYNSSIKYTLVNINGRKYFYYGASSIGISTRDFPYSQLIAGTTYLLTVLYTDDYNRSYTTSTNVTIPTNPQLYMESNPPGSVPPTPPTFNTITLTFIDPLAPPGPIALVQIGQYRITATGPNIPPLTLLDQRQSGPITEPPLPYTFTGLVANTTYTFTCTLSTVPLSQYDLTPLVVSTVPINNIPTLSVSPYTYSVNYPLTSSSYSSQVVSNFQYVISPIQPITDLSGYLKYSINGGSTITYNILAYAPFYQIPTDLSGTGDISCSLIYADAYGTQYYSPITNYSYNTAFGLYNLSAAPLPLTLNSSSGVGTTKLLGYTFMSYSTNNTSTSNATMPGQYIGRKFNKITFTEPIKATITTGPIVFVAQKYDISFNKYADYNPNGTPTNPNIIQVQQNAYINYIINLNISPNLTATSNSISLSSSTPISTVSLTFATPITITTDTIILFTITSGTGSIQFTTYTSSDPSITPPYVINTQNSQATGLRYDYSNNLSNTFALPAHNGVSCQFSYV